MKEILFRAKPDICSEWLEEMELTLNEHMKAIVPEDHYNNGFVYGQVVYNEDNTKAWIVGKIIDVDEDYIIHEFWVRVKPETIGQYTGLRDKNDVKIFEGDLPGGAWEGLSIGKCKKCASFQIFTPDECMACMGDVMWSEFVCDVHEGLVEVIVGGERRK